MMVKCIINTFNKFHESFLLKIFEEEMNLKFNRDLAKSILKQKKSITHISQEEKKTSINIYFIIQPFFHFKASKQ